MKFTDILASAENNDKLDELRNDFVTLIAGALSRTLASEELPPNAEHIADVAYAAAHHALCRLHQDMPYKV
jgi:hypothetical protein